MFAQNEHQKYMVNIYLIYIILEVNWDGTNTDQKLFVKYLTIYSIHDIVRLSKVQKSIDEVLFQFSNGIIGDSHMLKHSSLIGKIQGV